MPNRIIKESICTSDTIDSLKPFEEIFFYRLIVNCDDYGRLDARPAILKAKLFPLKADVREKQINDALAGLSLSGIVDVYLCDGRPYLQLTNWAKHQQIRNKKSKYPAKESGCSDLNSFDINCNQKNSDDSKCPRNPIQSNPNPNPIQIYKEPETVPDHKKEILDFFDRVCDLYPNKKGKSAVSYTRKQELYKVGFETLEKCIIRYKKYLKDNEAWLKPQNCSTFFNRGYKDYLNENYEGDLIDGNIGGNDRADETGLVAEAIKAGIDTKFNGFDYN